MHRRRHRGSLKVSTTETETGLKLIVTEMKDELEELINNIKASAISVIATLASISQINQDLDVNSLEYRLRKTRIACLSLKFVDLMKR